MELEGKGSEATRLTKGRRDSRDDYAEDCPVCLTAFDDTIQRPRTLPCGHTLCTPCINGLKNQGQVMCPSCRIVHPVPKAGRFPISYAFEALIRRLRDASSSSSPLRPEKDTGEAVPSPVTESGQKGPAGLIRPIRSLLQEQEVKVLAAIRTCQEVQEQLDQYQTTLVNWGEQQQDLEDRLQALVDQSKDARVFVREEESQVATKKEQVQQGEQQLHALLQTLRTVTTGLEAYQAIEDADHCANEENQRAEECRGIFPDVHTVTTISKVREASSAALEAAMTVQVSREIVGAPAGDEGDPGIPATPGSSITDRFEALLTPTLESCYSFHLTPHPLQAKDLINLTQQARRLVQTGLVFAIHQQEGRSQHARINFEDGRLYLHSLQDQPPPPRAVTVQVDEVVPDSPPCLVFLDLAWPGSEPRRVLIRLSPDTRWSRQFLLLCTGQRGPCYANTRLWEVVGKGQPGEWVFGGDYQYNNGTGGAALLPDLDEDECQASRQAGDVWRWRGDLTRGAVFGITTRGSHTISMRSVLGKVVSGLEGVVAAAQHSPITEVTVVDCGVVLWA